MRKIVVIALFLAVSLFTTAQQRIIGGSAVDISQRPYQAAIFINGIFNGGGTIISPYHILTAAHVVCYTGTTSVIPTSSIKVSVGCTNLNNCSKSSIQSVEIYPQFSYVNSITINDVAIITLSSPLTYSTNVQAIQISNNTSYSSGTQAIVSGWGAQHVHGNSYLSQLYKANVTVSSCTSENIEATASASMAYHGDSGGPLTITSNGNDILIGLVSYGSTQNPTSAPSYYTNVGSYYNWILSNIAPRLSAPSAICTTATAQILNFPTGCTVNWSVSNSCIQITSGQGTDSVTLQRNDDGWATLTATISYNGTVVKTLSKEIMVGTPAFCMNVIPVAADGSQGYWRSDLNGNSIDVEFVNSNAHYPSYVVDLYRIDNGFSVGTHLGHWVTTSLSDMTFGYYPQGWYYIEVVGVNDCGTSTAWGTELECLDGNDLQNRMFSFVYEQSSAMLTVTLNHASERSQGLSRNQSLSGSASAGSYEVQLWNENTLLRSYKTTDAQLQIPMSGMKSGLYVVRAIINGKTQQRKLIKK